MGRSWTENVDRLNLLLLIRHKLISHYRYDLHLISLFIPGNKPMTLTLQVPCCTVCVI